MKVKVYAKVNLTLNVTGKSGKFHDLDSVVASVGLFDEVEVRPTEGGVRVSGMPEVAQEDNTAYKAAKAFFARFGKEGGCDVAIRKGIPTGCGLGGSSADAAAVLFCLCRLHDVPLEEEGVAETAQSVGSDVLFMMRGSFGRMDGRGRAHFLPYVPMSLCLTTFQERLSTAAVFAAYDKTGGGVPADNDRVLSYLSQRNFAAARSQLRNMLQTAATRSGYADTYLTFCAENGFPTAMTGSGSAFFLLCEGKDAAECAARTLRQAGFAAVAVTSVPVGVEVLQTS